MATPQIIIAGLIGLAWAFMSFYLEPLFPLGSPAWLGMTIIVVTLAALVLFWRKIQRFASEMSVLGGLLVFVGVGAVLGGGIWALMRATSDASPPSNVSSITIHPKNYSANIRFELKQILPAEDPHEPFALQIQNVGEHNVVQAKFRFRVGGFDFESLVENSPSLIVARRNERGGVWFFTEKTETGQSTVGVYPSSFAEFGQRIVDLIPARGSETIEIQMPDAIKTALSFVMIAKSSKIHEKSFEKMKDMPTGDLDKLQEWLEENRFRNFVEMPEVEIQFTGRLPNNVETSQIFVLRSVYFPVIPPMWVNDSTSGAPKSFLTESQGILSYENLYEPEKGLYSQWKKRGGG